MTSFLQNLEAGFQKDEQWVIAEITKGWQLLRTVGHTTDVDIQNIFTWIQAHHATILGVFQGALTAAATLGSIVPGGTPAVAAATLAIDAATAAIDSLSKTVVAGSTPLSTIVNAYHAVKTASSAANVVIVQATSKPPVAVKAPT